MEGDGVEGDKTQQERGVRGDRVEGDGVEGDKTQQERGVRRGG